MTAVPKGIWAMASVEVLGPERRIYRVPLRVLGQMLSLTVENDGGNDFTAAAPMVVFTAERV